MSYIFELLKLKEGKKEVSRLEIDIDSETKKTKKIAAFTIILEIICLVTFIIFLTGLVFVCINIISLKFLSLENTLKLLEILIVPAIICALTILLHEFIDDENKYEIKDFVDKVTLVNQNNISINFNIDKEIISYFDEEGILHEIFIPEENEIKYWNKDYIKISINKNKLVKYYPIEYR